MESDQRKAILRGCSEKNLQKEYGRFLLLKPSNKSYLGCLIVQWDIY